MRVDCLGRKAPHGITRRDDRHRFETAELRPSAGEKLTMVVRVVTDGSAVRDRAPICFAEFIGYTPVSNSLRMRNYS